MSQANTPSQNKDAKNHYLFEVPSRTGGIYMILNVLKKTVYIGLAQNLVTRTFDHFKAICCNTSEHIFFNDNEGIINEKDKDFLHLPIWNSRRNINNSESDQKLRDQELRDCESIYIYLFRTAGFKLYNSAKRDIEPEEIISNSIEINSHEDFTRKKAELIESLNDKLRTLPPLHDCSVPFQAISDMDESERCELWKNLIKTFKGSDEVSQRYKLTKSTESSLKDKLRSRYIYDPAFSKIWSMLSRFSLSKEKLGNLDINWNAVSFFDKKLNLDRLTVISNYGSHNGEAPYDILKKKDEDLKKHGRCYWAFKKLPSSFMRTVKEELGSAPLYVTFKTTTSDNSTQSKKKPHLESIKTPEEMEREYERLVADNSKDVKNFYFDESTGCWEPIEREFPVTSPWGNNNNNKESLSFAFIISEFLICKENIPVIDELKKQNGLIRKLGCSENSGQTPTYFGQADFGNKPLANDCPIEDETQIFFAKLEYPYVRPIAHIPDFNTYLSCVTDGAFDPVILLITPRSSKLDTNTRVMTAITLDRDGNAYVLDNINTTLGDIKDNESNLMLFEEIKRNGTEGSFELSDLCTLEIKYDGKVLHYEPDKHYDPLSAGTSLYVGGDNTYAYYGYPVADSKLLLFRYSGHKIGGYKKPPFIFSD